MGRQGQFDFLRGSVKFKFGKFAPVKFRTAPGDKDAEFGSVLISHQNVGAGGGKFVEFFDLIIPFLGNGGFGDQPVTAGNGFYCKFHIGLLADVNIIFIHAGFERNAAIGELCPIRIQNGFLQIKHLQAAGLLYFRNLKFIQYNAGFTIPDFQDIIPFVEIKYTKIPGVSLGVIAQMAFLDLTVIKRVIERIAAGVRKVTECDFCTGCFGRRDGYDPVSPTVLGRFG